MPLVARNLRSDAVPRSVLAHGSSGVRAARRTYERFPLSTLERVDVDATSTHHVPRRPGHDTRNHNTPQMHKVRIPLAVHGDPPPPQTVFCSQKRGVLRRLRYRRKAHVSPQKRRNSQDTQRPRRLGGPGMSSSAIMWWAAVRVRSTCPRRRAVKRTSSA